MGVNIYSADNLETKAVREAVSKLLKETGFKEPPVDLNKIAPRLNVFKIKTGQCPTSKGLLFSERGELGYTIELDELLDPKERQFYIGHELGHIIVAKTRGKQLPDADFYDEQLCNYAAAEFLIPHDWLRNGAALPKEISAKFFCGISEKCQLPINWVCDRFCYETTPKQISGTAILWDCAQGSEIATNIYWLRSADQLSLLDHRLKSPAKLAKSTLIHDEHYEKKCLVSLLAPDGEKIDYHGTIARSSFANYLSYFPISDKK